MINTISNQINPSAMKVRVPSIEQKVNALDAKYNSKLEFLNRTRKALKYAVIGGLVATVISVTAYTVGLSKDLLNNYVNGKDSAVSIVQNYNPSPILWTFGAFALVGASAAGRRYSERRMESLESEYDLQLEKLVNAKEKK